MHLSMRILSFVEKCDLCVTFEKQELLPWSFGHAGIEVLVRRPESLQNVTYQMICI